MSSEFDRYAARVAPPRPDNSTVLTYGPLGLSPVWLAVFVVFLTLKLGVGDTQVEGWSWLWVAAPLWGPWVLSAVLLVVFAVASLIVDAFRS